MWAFTAATSPATLNHNPKTSSSPGPRRRSSPPVKQVRGCEEQSGELELRQFRSVNGHAANSSLDINDTITATQF